MSLESSFRNMEVEAYGGGNRRLRDYVGDYGGFNRAGPQTRAMVYRALRMFQGAVRGYQQRRRTDSAPTYVPRKAAPPKAQAKAAPVQTSNGMHIGGIVKGAGKRKRKYFKKKPVFNKRQKKSVKAIALAQRYEKCVDWKKEDMFQMESAVNKVQYTVIGGAVTGSWRDYLLNQIMYTASNGVTSLVMEQPEDLNATAGAFKLYKILYVMKMLIRNNTNSPCNLVIYQGHCTDLSTISMSDDLTQRVEREFCTSTLSPAAPTAAPLIEDMHFQYWYTKNMKDGHWKVTKRTVVRLNPGDEYKFFGKHTFYIDTKTIGSYGSNNYLRGYPAWLVRQVGVPTHDTTTGNSTGICNTSLDVLREQSFFVKSRTGRSLTNNRNVIAPTGFSAITPVAVSEDTVGPYDEL